MKKILFLLAILVLAVFLRFFRLADNPVGFYSDEAAFSYNSFSLLKTGRDEYGDFLPVVLKSFGDYKAGLYSYYLIPYIYFAGLNVFSVRSGSAVLGLLQIWLGYIIAFELFRSKKTAILSAFIFSITPLGLQFNRMVHENNLSAVLTGLSFYNYLKSRRKSAYLIPALFFSLLSIYAYHDAKIVAPLTVLFFLFYLNKAILKEKRIIIPAILLAVIMVLPFFRVLGNKESWTRLNNTSLFTDTSLVLTVNLERGESGNTFLSRIIQNKATFYSR